jgi:hypothetical protein
MLGARGNRGEKQNGEPDSNPEKLHRRHSVST